MTEKILETNGMNPILPPEIYTADGEPKVFDGRLYLYGSHDIFGGKYCSYDYHVYSASVSDLTKWIDHGVCFRSRDDNGNIADVPWSDALLYAPDAVKVGEKYYLYFCLSDGTEGVAESDSPSGPFLNARRITLNGKPIEGIDPSVLYDDGKFYYTWGQFHMKMAELESDMCTLKPDTFHDNILTNDGGAQGFHEGSSLRKIGDKYCIVYASEWKEEYPNKSTPPTKLDYAVSDLPYGPYKRMGTIIDNFGIDPKSWNNHGSIIKINGDWYVFYHGSSCNSGFNRRARVEKITVDEVNAVIYKAEMTTGGFLNSVPASYIKSPVNACAFSGGAFLTERNAYEFPLVNVSDGCSVVFRFVHFKKSKFRFTVFYSAVEDGALTLIIDETPAVEIKINKADNTAFAEFEVNESRDSSLELLFKSSQSCFCEIYCFEFAELDNGV